jgi:uncharacterized protein (DUF3084 family)
MLQFNKRDLSNISSVEELNSYLNERGQYEFREAVAVNGTGVEETFQRINHLVMKGIAEKHKITIEPPEELVEAIVDSDRSAPHAFDSSSFEPSAIGTKKAVAESAERGSSSPQTAVQGESLRSKEPPARDMREMQAIPREKLELIISSMQDLSHTVKELKNMVHNLQSEVKDLKKDQKEIHARIKDVNLTINNIKTKKRWFSFL